MKRKILGSVVALSLVLTMLCGCSGSKDESGDAVYGQITKIDDKGITIDVGTLNEDMFSNMNGGGPNAGEDKDTDAGNDASSGADDDGSIDAGDAGAAGMGDDASADTVDDGSGFGGDNESRPDMNESRPVIEEDGQFDGNFDKSSISSMITLSGDEKTYKITDDTVYKRRAGGGFGMGREGGPFGENGRGENGGEDNESRPDRESVNTEDGDDVPRGDIPESDMPTGNRPESDTPTGDMPDGDMPTGDMPDRESFSDREDMDFDLEDMSSMDEEISSDELEVGDMVEITLDKHGKIDTITVFMFGMMGRQYGDDTREDTSDLGDNTQAFYENRMQGRSL